MRGHLEETVGGMHATGGPAAWLRTLLVVPNLGLQGYLCVICVTVNTKSGI